MEVLLFCFLSSSTAVYNGELTQRAAGNVVLMGLRKDLYSEPCLCTYRDTHIEGTAVKDNDQFLHWDMANSGTWRVEVNKDCYATHLSQKWNFISVFVFP